MVRPFLAGYVSQSVLAESLGLAASTVSRALRDDPRITPEVRARVVREAERLGYRTHPMVSALMSRVRSVKPAAPRWNLAWLDFDSRADRWRADAVCRAFYDSATARASALGYAIERVWVADPRLSRRDLSDVLFRRGVKGVLLQGFPAGAMGDSNRIPVRLSDFVVVGVGTSFRGPDLHYATNDQHLSMQRAVRELWRIGYRRIGYVGRELIECVVSRRFSAGYLVTLREELEGDVLPVLLTERGDAFLAWLNRERPDAIVSTESWVMRALGRAGYRVPEDVGFAHLHVSADETSISGICQQSEEVAAAAVDLAVNAIVANEIGVPRHPRGVLIGGVWVAGKTTRPQ